VIENLISSQPSISNCTNNKKLYHYFTFPRFHQNRDEKKNTSGAKIDNWQYFVS
jgi:hypothetical protein